MPDETYDPARIDALRAMLRALAERILTLDRSGRLLDEPGPLLQALGDVRNELFRYEVRITYDTPEIADHRRIIGEATGWTPDDDAGRDEEDEWQRPDDP